MKPRTVRCKKTLVNDCGVKNFTKGKEYSIMNEPNAKDLVCVYDDQNESHVLGNWAKHFKF